MGLRERLETLDQAVLEQFERLTQKANRELGWNKYDLKRVADGAACFSVGAIGMYSILTGILGEPVFSGTSSVVVPLAVIAGTVMLGISYAGSKDYNFINDISERAEAQLAQQGVTPAPSLNPYRPLSLLLPAAGAAAGYAIQKANAILPDGTVILTPAFFQSLGFMLYGVSAFISFQICSSYLQDTTMIPPSAEKKSFFKTLYQRAAAAIMPKPQPEKVPAPTIDYATPTEVST